MKNVCRLGTWMQGAAVPRRIICALAIVGWLQAGCKARERGSPPATMALTVPPDVIALHNLRDATGGNLAGRAAITVPAGALLSAKVVEITPDLVKWANHAKVMLEPIPIS